MFYLIQGFLLFIWMLSVPILIGTGLVRWAYKKTNCMFGYLFGFMYMLAIFEIIAVPAIKLQIKLTTVMVLWLAIVVVSVIVSIIYFLNLHSDKQLVFRFQLKDYLKATCKKEIIIWSAVAFLIGIELVIYIFGMHSDLDDTRFVANSVVTWNRDSMLLVNPQTGMSYDRLYGEATKDAVAPWSMYVAMLARLVQIHPTILSHTVLPIFLLCMSYISYYFLIQVFVGKNKVFHALGMLFLCLFVLFGKCSAFSAATFMLTRIWQGKAIVASVTIPLLLVHLVAILDDYINRCLYVLLTILLLGSCVFSGMGLILGLLLTLSQIFIYGIQKRSLSIWSYGVLSCIPNFVLAILYLKG